MRDQDRPLHSNIFLERFYMHDENNALIKCGECWFSDICKTKRGEYTGDEIVHERDLILLSGTHYQCDDCGMQGDRYDDL